MELLQIQITMTDGIYGGYSAQNTNDYVATGNQVIINGGTFTSKVYGAYSQYGKVKENGVAVGGSTTEMKNVYGLVLIQWLVLVCHILLTFLHSYVLSCLYLKQSFSLVFYLLSVICLFALKCFLQTTQNKQALSLTETIKTKLRKVFLIRYIIKNKQQFLKNRRLLNLQVKVLIN